MKLIKSNQYKQFFKFIGDIFYAISYLERKYLNIQIYSKSCNQQKKIEFFSNQIKRNVEKERNDILINNQKYIMN